MPKACKVWINGEQLTAKPGDLLLDVALANGVELPHDCRSGYCGTCQVRVVRGRCLGTLTSNSDVVHACQTRIIADVHVVAERVPELTDVSGTVVGVTDIAPDVLELSVECRQPVNYVPGQYVSLRFRGFPARYYSPTAPLDWPHEPGLLRFHVRWLPTGRVSSALGRRIKKGHRVKVTGPFGAAYFRPDQRGRFVLVSSGTGFAPIWAITEAAIKEKPERELVLIAGARELTSLYMIPALCRLAMFPQVTIIATVSSQQNVTPAIRCGSPASYLPPLSSRDVVYVAGAPALVEAVGRVARASGAPCFADPFLPASGRVEDRTFVSRTAEWFVPAAQNTRRPELLLAGH